MSMYAVICFLSLAGCVWGSCMMSHIKMQLSPYGTRTFHCEYKGLKLGTGTEINNVEDCKKCSCTPSGLSCCGYGINGGTWAPRGCKVVADGCNVIFVQPDDVRQRCVPH